MHSDSSEWLRWTENARENGASACFQSTRSATLASWSSLPGLLGKYCTEAFTGLMGHTIVQPVVTFTNAVLRAEEHSTGNVHAPQQSQTAPVWPASFSPESLDFMHRLEAAERRDSLLLTKLKQPNWSASVSNVRVLASTLSYFHDVDQYDGADAKDEVTHIRSQAKLAAPLPTPGLIRIPSALSLSRRAARLFTGSAALQGLRAQTKAPARAVGGNGVQSVRRLRRGKRRNDRKSVSAKPPPVQGSVAAALPIKYTPTRGTAAREPLAGQPVEGIIVHASRGVPISSGSAGARAGGTSQPGHPKAMGAVKGPNGVKGPKGGQGKGGAKGGAVDPLHRMGYHSLGPIAAGAFSTLLRARKTSAGSVAVKAGTQVRSRRSPFEGVTQPCLMRAVA